MKTEIKERLATLGIGPDELECIIERCARNGIHVKPNLGLSTDNAAKFMDVSTKKLATDRSSGDGKSIPFSKPLGHNVEYSIIDLLEASAKTYTSTAQARIARNSAGQK